MAIFFAEHFDLFFKFIFISFTVFCILIFHTAYNSANHNTIFILARSFIKHIPYELKLSSDFAIFTNSDKLNFNWRVA